MPGGPGDFCEAGLMLERLCLCQTTWLCSALATLHTGQSEPNMHLGNKKDATGCQFLTVGESTFKTYEKPSSHFHPNVTSNSHFPLLMAYGKSNLRSKYLCHHNIYENNLKLRNTDCNVGKSSLKILSIMTARKRLTFKVVWAAFDEHRIMKHSGPSVKNVLNFKNPAESLKQRHAFENTKLTFYLTPVTWQ